MEQIIANSGQHPRCLKCNSKRICYRRLTQRNLNYKILKFGRSRINISEHSAWTKQSGSRVRNYKQVKHSGKQRVNQRTLTELLSINANSLAPATASQDDAEAFGRIKGEKSSQTSGPCELSLTISGFRAVCQVPLVEESKRFQVFPEWQSVWITAR